MNCPKCGFISTGNSKFCMKCGNQMGEQSIQSVISNPNIGIEQTGIVGENNINASQSVPSQPVEQPVNTEVDTLNIQTPQTPPTPQVPPESQATQPQQQAVQPQQTPNPESLNYIFFIIAVLVKPVTTIKEELHKFNDTKTSIIFALIIAGTTTIINLIKTVFSVVVVTGYDWSIGKNTTTWNWDNLEYLNWGELIFKNFLLYAGILVGIAGVYYLAALIIKKEVIFTRFLGITSISVIPFVLGSLVVSPVIGKIYLPLAIIALIVGAIYTIILLLDGVNRELALEDNDMKLYINLACLSIIGSIGYYVFLRFFFTVSTSVSDLNSIFDLLN